MTCHKIATPGGFAIVCIRGQRKPKCRTCGARAEWICDGCDSKLCDGCRVSAKPIEAQRDFCPTCFADVWRLFLKCHPEVRAFSQLQRREAFRAWAVENPGAFGKIPLTKAGAR